MQQLFVEIRTDQGMNFTSAIFKAFGQIIGIDKIRTTTLHPLGEKVGPEQFEYLYHQVISCFETRYYSI